MVTPISSRCSALIPLIFVFLLVLAKSQLLGGRQDMSNADLVSSTVRNVAGFAIDKVKKEKIESGEYSKCVEGSYEILRGQKQVVAGVNYYLTVKLTPTLNPNIYCPPLAEGKSLQTYMCDFVVFSQAWSRTTEVTKASCLPVTN